MDRKRLMQTNGKGEHTYLKKSSGYGTTFGEYKSGDLYSKI